MDKEPLLENEEQGNVTVYPTLPDVNDDIETEGYQQRQHDTNCDDNYISFQSQVATTQQVNGMLIPAQIHPIDGNHLQNETSVFLPHYSGIAWLSLLFCCFPLSISAVYKSDKFAHLLGGSVMFYLVYLLVLNSPSNYFYSYEKSNPGVDNSFFNKTIKAIRKGDIYEARRNSFAARKLSYLAIIFGIFFIVAVIIIYVIVKFKLTHVTH